VFHVVFRNSQSLNEMCVFSSKFYAAPTTLDTDVQFMLLYIAVSKEYLTMRHGYFRPLESAFPCLYCLSPAAIAKAGKTIVLNVFFCYTEQNLISMIALLPL